ncbi:MAG: redoxin domain-containing protein [Saprospiraceae bacterium]|nr:redoxin domain-containing protein [Saprospiraceae bacterium]
MSDQTIRLPQVGDLAPTFSISSSKGRIDFPQYCRNCWCVLFAHPANFTSAWEMYSAFLALKERWLDERNTKFIALSNEPLKHNSAWSDKARRYLGIYLKTPVIEDLDFRIANLYGIASGRRPVKSFDRLAFIIDPMGVIRMIINRPLPNIETAILTIQQAFDQLRSNDMAHKIDANLNDLSRQPIPEVSDIPEGNPQSWRMKPAYFRRSSLIWN